MRYCEIRVDHQGCHDEDDQQPPVRKEWRPMVRSQIHHPAVAINMVVILPHEFRVVLEEELNTEETVAQLLLDPQAAIFEKPTKSKHWHLKAPQVSEFVNGKSMEVLQWLWCRFQPFKN
jgi:hypothetical protein